MKKFFGTRVGVIILTMIVCMVLFSSVALGAGIFNKDVPVTMTIKATTPDIGIFSDIAYSIPITTLDFGNVDSGTPKIKTVYVKNAGNKDFSSITLSSNLDPAVGTITGTIPALPKTGSATVVLTLNTVESATDITPTVVVTLTGNY